MSNKINLQGYMSSEEFLLDIGNFIRSRHEFENCCLRILTNSRFQEIYKCMYYANTKICEYTIPEKFIESVYFLFKTIREMPVTLDTRFQIISVSKNETGHPNIEIHASKREVIKFLDKFD